MASHIERRKLLATLGGAAAWPLAAHAQQTAGVRTIGFLLPGGSRTTVMRTNLEAFRQGLKENGWIEGQNIRSNTVLPRVKRTRLRRSPASWLNCGRISSWPKERPQPERRKLPRKP